MHVKHIGTVKGGMRQNLTPVGTPVVCDIAPIGTLKQTLVRTNVLSKDLGEALRQLVIDLSKEIMGDIVLMEHLLADLNKLWVESKH